MNRAVTLLLAMALSVGCLISAGFAATEAQLAIDDQAGLLSAAETERLQALFAEQPQELDVALVTAKVSGSTTESFAEQYAIQHYGNAPAVLFLIDLGNRQLYVYANESAQKTITKADARAITDNVYRYASNEDYDTCTEEALEQILTICQGRQIARPVKHITNAMIAVLFGILLNYYLAVRARRQRTVPVAAGGEGKPALRQMADLPTIATAAPIVMRSERKYHSTRSSGARGIGGGGGGGHSGGGGGHSF